MQSIILAAGMGKRLKELTSNNTKCMIKVNGITLIERALRQLDGLGLSRIIIVVGYEGQKLIDFIYSLNIKTEIIYVNNPVYSTTNNIYSLALASDYMLHEDTLLLESDLVFEKSILTSLLNDPRPSLAIVDKYESWMDGTVVKISADDSIIDFVSKAEFNFNDIPKYYKTVNIYKFSKDFSTNHYVPFLKAYQTVLGKNQYYEQVLKVLTMIGDSELKAKRLENQVWYEIDDIQDLDIASSLFAEAEDQLTLIQSRFGGYWRYPRLLDFCYLVNPFFPPQRMIDEIKANFEILLTSYPSGMKVNSLLAAKNFDLHQDNIVVGNGAAELIKSIMECLNGKVGVIRPTFEEYPNRKNSDDLVCYVPKGEGFSYGINELMSFFDGKDINSLLLINPDNPSGNYIEKEDVLRLSSWCHNRKIKFILDESFVDFSSFDDTSFLHQELIEANPSLIVVKSISKSYGVPGLRLGIVASADKELISFVKKDVSIWNINSFAEFYMQIESKYTEDYNKALFKLKVARANLIEGLKKIKNIRVYPSEANYVLCELTGKMSARDLTVKLFSKHEILIKDLTGKIKNGRQYIRLAVRNNDDNNILLKALADELL